MLSFDYQPTTHQSYLTRALLHQSEVPDRIMYSIASDWDECINPFEAAAQAAQKIYDRFQEPPNLLLSGGLDSECMLRAFIHAKVPFHPVIMNFKKNFNDFDTKWALVACQNFGLSPTIKELDLDNFYESKAHLHYAKEYYCRSPQLATHIWLLEQLKGPSVLTYNPLPIRFYSKKKKYIAFPPELYMCYDVFFQKNQQAGVGFFFLYTADLLYSFLKLPLYLEMLFNTDEYVKNFTFDINLVKHELYRSGGFNAQIRRHKATGFEHYRQFLNKKHGLIGQDYYDLHFRKPMEELAQDPGLVSLGNIDLKRLFSIWQNLPQKNHHDK